LALGGSLLLNLVFLFGESLDSENSVREKYYSHTRLATPKVAILSIEGTILDTDGFVKQQIDKVKEDKNVKAVVLRIDSPGGTVTASDYLYHHLQKLTQDSKMPIVVSMGGLAASGGYYVAMAVGSAPDTIFAEPSTWTGSIGVILPHYNASGLMKEWGVEEDSVASHRLKGMGSFARAMTSEEREIFQTLIDDGFQQFKEIVKSGRPKFKKDPAALDKVATGQVFTAQQAQRLGLVDRIGFLEDAVDRAIELAKLNKDEVCVVKYKPQPSLSNLLLGAQSRGRGLSLGNAMEMAALLDWTAPRAYYLCTLMPSLLQPTLARP
jgi:protease-4